MSASFATYAYELDENGKPYIGTRTEYSYGRFGRFKGTSQTFSYTLTPEKLRKFFSGKKDDDDDDKRERNLDDKYDTGVETNTWRKENMALKARAVKPRRMKTAMCHSLCHGL